MYGREKRVLLRHYLEQGLKKTELADKLGISRRAVYHWIETAFVNFLNGKLQTA